MLINRTALTNAIGRILANMQLKGCSQLDIYNSYNWRARCKEPVESSYIVDFYRGDYIYYQYQ